MGSGVLLILSLLVFCEPAGAAEVVFIADGSASVASDGYSGELGIILNFLTIFETSNTTFSAGYVQGSGADALGLRKPIVLREDVLKLPFPGSALTIDKALIKAESLFTEDADTLKVLVIISANDIQCGAAGDFKSASVELPNPCREVASLRSRGVLIVTIALIYPDVGRTPRIDIAHPADAAFSLNDIALYEDISSLLEIAASSWNTTTPSFSTPRQVHHRQQLPPDGIEHAPVAHGGAVEKAMQPERQCSDDYTKLWIDVIFILDSSRGVGHDGFNGLIGMILGAVQNAPVGQTALSTRVALINLGEEATIVGDLESFKSQSEVQDALLSLRYKGAEKLNIIDAMIAATKILSSSAGSDRRSKLVVLFTSDYFECSVEETSDPCRAIQAVKDQATLMTVSMNYPDHPTPLMPSVASPCFATLSGANWLSDFRRLALQANCQCADARFKQVTNGGCTRFGTCVRYHPEETSVKAAASICRRDGARLISILNWEKQSFLNGLLPNDTASINSGYHIGLEMYGVQTGLWASGNSFDYGNFHRPPTPGSETFATRYYGITEWHSQAADSIIGRPYFCEKDACDAATFCV